MELLYLSHCSPDAPNKGDKIRAHYFAAQLAERHRLHMVAFVRSVEEERALRALAPRFASLYCERLHTALALPCAGLHFALGASLSVGFYRSAALRAHVERLRGAVALDAALVYSVAMSGYAPADVPLVMDFCDNDSEKWLELARLRHPGFLFRLEGERLRRIEQRVARRAHASVFTSHGEAALLRQAVPGVRVECVENGVDFDYWRADLARPLDSLHGRRYVVLIGQLDYFPNVEGAVWFAEQVLPRLRRAAGEWEFLVVGRRPTREVRRLARLPGVEVLAGPPDVRPHAAAAAAVVTPLRLARGLQNKVLEALALGKRVFASPQVGATFGAELPPGITLCADAAEYAERLAAAAPRPGESHDWIREAAQKRFQWSRAGGQLERLLAEARAQGGVWQS